MVDSVALYLQNVRGVVDMEVWKSEFEEEEVATS